MRKTLAQYQPTSDDQELEVTNEIGIEWPEPPPKGHLHVFVALPAGVTTPTLIQAGECFIRPFARVQDM